MKGLNIEYACDIYTVAYIYKGIVSSLPTFSYTNIKLLFNSKNTYLHKVFDVNVVLADDKVFYYM